MRRTGRQVNHAGRLVLDFQPAGYINTGSTEALATDTSGRRSELTKTGATGVVSSGNIPSGGGTPLGRYSAHAGMMKDTFQEVANLLIRTMEFETAGEDWQDLADHVHSYDHAHFVSRGRMRVHVNGESTDYTAPALIYIKAGLHHRMEALEPGTVGHCIHALRSADLSGEPLDPALVPNGVLPTAVAAPITTVRTT